MKTWMRAMLLSLPAMVLGVAPAAAQDTGEESINCVSSPTTGAGAKLFQTCVTETGNLLLFRHGTAGDQIIKEGYLICEGANGVAHSTGPEEGGFNLPTTHTSASNVRTTTNGRYKLTQAFARDPIDKRMEITMTLKNLGPGPAVNVNLVRYFTAQAGGAAGDDVFIRSPNSIVAADTPNGFGVMLGVTSADVSHTTTVQAVADWETDRDDCGLQNVLGTPTAAGSFGGRVTFALGNINAAGTKQVKVFYMAY